MYIELHVGDFVYKYFSNHFLNHSSLMVVLNFMAKPIPTDWLIQFCHNDKTY